MMGKLPKPEKIEIRLWDLVHAFCIKTNLSAERAWSMTVSDLVLCLLPENEDNNTADNQIEQRLICNRIDERLKLLDGLTLEERIELENYKAKVM